METKNITILDNQSRNLKDKTSIDSVIGNNKYGVTRGGLVKIFEELKDGKRKLIDKSNLIVYSGRKILAQRAINQDRVPGSLEKDYYISWFSLGSGGTSGATPLQPNPPSASDVALNNEIIIDDSVGTVCVNGGRKHPIDSFTFEQDAENLNEPLIVKTTTTLDYGDANGYNISEAGLWMSDSNIATSVTLSTLTLWAKVTFSTIVKNSSRKLVFDWFLYF